MTFFLPVESATLVEYRLEESFNPTERSLVADATFCDLEMDAMLMSNQWVKLTRDMRDFLETEAHRRGVDISAIYDEEVAAREELARITPSNADLFSMADRSPAPQAWYDE